MDASFPSSMVAAAGSDALANVENVIGSDYDDTLMGNAADNVISGGKGVDTIHGWGGSDWLAGGPDDDAYRFAATGGRDGVSESSGYDIFDFSEVAADLACWDPLNVHFSQGQLQGALTLHGYIDDGPDQLRRGIQALIGDLV